MPDNVAEWLEKLGLVQYASNFIDNDIDTKLLPQLSNADLKELGIYSLGHRKTILHAIEALGQQEFEPIGRVSSKDEAERRQLTVMFCDLVGSTELSQRLDPEELREINRNYQDACKFAIERFDGYIARYMGDGVLAYFGYPRAHEDDPERAIRAGLKLVKSISLIGAAVKSEPETALSVRIGIDTGPVVVGDLIGEGASQESSVVGETPNLAARLQAIAKPNTVVVSQSTRELAGEFFQYQDFGEQKLKGIKNPVKAWRPIEERKSDSRYQALHSEHISPLVGREEEFEIIRRRWQKSCAGEGEVVLLCGEAGIGKSRLTRAIDELASTSTDGVIRYQCSPHYTNSALFPVIVNLENYFALGTEMSSSEKIEKIESQLRVDALEVERSAALYSSLLSIPVQGRYPVSNATPQQQKDQTLKLLSEHIFKLAERQPVLIVFEDVHWADPTSIELLDLIIAAIPKCCVMVLLTFRPEFQPAWVGESHVTVLTLNKLSIENCTPLIENLTGGKSLPEEVIQKIMLKTDGIPLFVEELTKTIMGSRYLKETEMGFVLKGDLDQVTIPDTLHDSLMARLDRQGAAKEVAQIGAVIGREFSHELIDAIYGKDAATCYQSLEKLLKTGLVFKRGTPPEATYIFKHALVQDAAYASLLKSKRKEIHKRIVKILLDNFTSIVETQPELIAYHCTEAELHEEALEYWQRAAQRALERSANAGAIAYLTKAISFFRHLPNNIAQQERELKLQIMLMTASIASKGYGAPDTVRVMDRVNELAEVLPNSPLIYSALYSQWVLRIIRAQISDAHIIAEKLLHLANQQQDIPPKIMGNRLFGITMLYEGGLEESLPYVDRAINLYNPELHTGLAYQYGQNPFCATLAHKAVLNQLLGNIGNSLSFGEQSVQYAHEVNHANTIAYALTYGVIIPGICRRDVPRIKEAAQKLIDASSEHNLPMWLGSAHAYRGWAMYHEGNRQEAVVEVKLGLEMYFGGGARLDQLLTIAMLAEYETSIGNIDAGFNYIEKALSQSENGGERCYLAELYRIKGTLYTHIQNETAQSEKCYQKSLDVARQQGSKWWELRTTVSFTRLLQEQGMSKQGYELLKPVYERFTEGFDTHDLIEAKELLQQLA